MNLNTFEIAQNIRSKQFTKAEAAINFFLKEAATNNGSLSTPTQDDPLANKTVNIEELHINFCNQFSSLISELFSAPSYKPSIETINVFIKYKFVVEWIFSVSLWNNTDALIEHLGLIKRDAAGNIKLNKRNATSLLMFITISSKYRLNWIELFKLSGMTAYLAYTCLLSQSIPALSKDSNSGFNYLLESAKGLPIFNLPLVGDLGAINYPFFSCSYATSPNKYEFKNWLTQLIRHNLPHWLSSDVRQSIEGIKSRKANKKKKIGVMLELFSENHAMYRCYKAPLEELSEQYELIAFTDKKEAEISNLSIFEKVVIFQNMFEISDNAASIIEEEIDILFYPSIGMKFWGIYLSQIRLAPMQLMMGGHPSSSFSPEIDYFLFSGNTFLADDLQPYISEKLILLNNMKGEYIQHFKHEELTTQFVSEHNQFLDDEEQIVIGINGVMTKVTYDIVEVCKKIEMRANKKVTFVFFSSNSVNSLAYLSAKKQLSKSLKFVEVSSYSNYITYLKVLSKCHFLLPTIPFGGTNSNIDAMVLNKPKLFLEGYAHLYTRTDQAEWEHVGLVNELSCNNKEDLVEKAVVLTNDKKEREALHQRIADKSCFETIFTNNENTDNILGLLINKAINEH